MIKIKKLKVFTIIVLIILLIEIIYILYTSIFQNKESLYFDGVNELEVNTNYYVTVGSNNNNDNHYEKAKLTKYNKNREKEFEKLYNTGYNSAFFGLGLDDTNIIVVGSYEKTKKDHENSIRRSLIVKYDKDGEIIFEKDFKLLDNSKFSSILVLEDGYLVTGQSIYQNTKIGTKEGGALLIKYDKEGNILWYKTYGSSKTALFNDLLVKDNNIYTVGIDDNHIGILCKYDMDGNLISFNDYKYTDDIGFSGIANINDSIYVTGSNKQNDNYTTAMIVEYDLECNYKQQITYEFKESVRYNRLIVDNDNKLVAIGIITSNKTSNNKTVDILKYDGIIGKYTEDLEEVEVVSYGDERDDYFTDIKEDNNEYLIVGYSSYEDGSYLSKFIRYSNALKVLDVIG